MLKFTFSGLLILSFLAVPSASWAEAAKVDVGQGLDASTADVSASTGTGAPGNSGTATVKTGTGGSGTGYVDPFEGLSCYEIWQQSAKKTCAYIAPGEVCPETFGGVAGPTVDLCTVVTPTDPAEAAAAQQAAARNYAMAYFRSLPLPVPQPKMSATEGTTGAVHQLDLQIPQQATFQDPGTPFGDLTVRAYGTFTVNWGDGTKSVYTTTGAPYPKSGITHTWTKRGHYVITVTGRWSADWTFGGFSGTLSGLQTTGTIPDFEVGDLQAIITN